MLGEESTAAWALGAFVGNRTAKTSQDVARMKTNIAIEKRARPPVVEAGRGRKSRCSGTRHSPWFCGTRISRRIISPRRSVCSKRPHQRDLWQPAVNRNTRSSFQPHRSPPLKQPIFGSTQHQKTTRVRDLNDGSETWIRTKIRSSRGCSPTIRRSRNDTAENTRG